MKPTQSQVITEQRNISKYAGLLCSRLILLACLFALLIFLPSTPFYFAVFLMFCPLILSHFLENQSAAREILLNSCAKKYFYTPARFAAEKIIGNSIVLLLSFWQLFYAPRVNSFISFHMAPGILLLIYLICRITITAIVHQRIHRLYMDLALLD